MSKLINVTSLKQTILKEFKQLASQTLIYGLGTMVPRFLNYVLLTAYFTNVLFANALQEYGKVTELYAYITFLMIVLTYGMETTFFRYSNKEYDKNKVYSTILACLTITSVVFFVCVIIFTQPIANVLKYEGEVIFIRLLGGILAVEAISAIPFAKLRVENKAKKFASLKAIQVFLNIGIMLFIYKTIPQLTGNADGLLNAEGIVSSRFIFIANLLASGTVLVLLGRELSQFKIGNIDWKMVKPFLAYGLPLMVSGLAGTINETLDRTIYKQVGNDTGLALKELGIYGANYKIGGFILMFIQMYRYAAEPYFFNKSKDIDSKQQYSNLMNIFVGIILSMALGILLFLPYIKGFIGENYHEGLFVVPYIVLAYVLYGVLFNLSVWFKLSDKTKYAFIIMVFGALITIVINIVFIPKFKYGASAVAHVISYACMVILSYLLGRKYYAIPYKLGRLFTYFLFAFAIYFIDKMVYIEFIALDFIIKLLLLVIFVTFVIWKEKLLIYVRSK